MDNCNYGNLKNELLRDELVVGFRDQELSKKLQLDPDLILEKTKKIIRQMKLSKNDTIFCKGMILKEPSLEEVRDGKVGSHTQTRGQTTVYTGGGGGGH